MPTVTFITADNQQHVVTVEAGTTAMEAATNELIPGIDGDCGGSAACGTCHVYVDKAWQEQTGPADPGIESDMLSLTDHAADNSRLSCQIIITDELDGLVLHMPAHQH